MGTETKKENKLIQIIEQSGLEKTKAQVLLEKFTSYFEIASEWEATAKALVITDASQLTEMKQAREGRLFLVKKRTAIETTRKSLKEDSLREGQTIDSIAKILTNILQPIEKDLGSKEKFAERLEAERKDNLKTERLELLMPFNLQYDNRFNLGEMDQAMFDSLLLGVKKAHEDKIKAEKKAEEDRLAKIKADEDARLKMTEENERLKKEADEKTEIRKKRNEELRPYIIFIRNYNTMLEMEEDKYTSALAEIIVGAKQHWEQEAKDAREKTEREEKEQKIQRQKEADAQLKLKKEREAREKAEAELKTRQELEAKAELEKQTLIEAELSKGDKDKFNDLIKDMEAILTKHTFKSKKYKSIQAQINELINKTINYAISKQ